MEYVIEYADGLEYVIPTVDVDAFDVQRPGHVAVKWRAPVMVGWRHFIGFERWYMRSLSFIHTIHA